MMTTIHLFGGDKGGVGKSFVCRAAVEYLLTKALLFFLFDTDRSNPDVLRMYKSAGNCQVAIFSEGERYEDTANQIYNSGCERTTVVNLPAQVLYPLRKWIEENELFGAGEEDDVVFRHWFVTDGGHDSFKLFIKYLNTFGEAMPHVLVKNFGRNEDWSSLDENGKIQELIRKYNVTVIDFPKFVGTSTRNVIDDESLTFAEATELEKLGRIGRQRAKRFLRESASAFEETGFFNEMSNGKIHSEA